MNIMVFDIFHKLAIEGEQLNFPGTDANMPTKIKDEQKEFINGKPFYRCYECKKPITKIIDIGPSEIIENDLDPQNWKTIGTKTELLKNQNQAEFTKALEEIKTKLTSFSITPQNILHDLKKHYNKVLDDNDKLILDSITLYYLDKIKSVYSNKEIKKEESKHYIKLITQINSLNAQVNINGETKLLKISETLNHIFKDILSYIDNSNYKKYTIEVLKPVCDNCFIAECGECGETESRNNLDKLDDGSLICGNCSEVCDKCDNVVREDEIAATIDNDQYCDKCLKSGLYSGDLVTCEDCHEIKTNDSCHTTYNDEILCDECSTTCESCTDVMSNRETQYVTARGETICPACFDNDYFICGDCGDIFNMGNAISTDHALVCEACFGNDYFKCRDCNDVYENSYIADADEMICSNCMEEYETSGNDKKILKEYEPYVDMSQVSVSSQDKIINILSNIVPISVKEMHNKYPHLAQAAKKVIKFNSGKEITKHTLDLYKKSLKPETYPLEYAGWNNLQRSVNEDTIEKFHLKEKQLVIKILASDEMLNLLKDKNVYDIFDKINHVSKVSSHPNSKNMLGWIRLELDPNNEFILIDEIQCDHLIAAKKIEKNEGDLLNNLSNHTKKSKSEIKDNIKNYKDIVKSFYDIAISTIIQFAKNHNFKTIYYHDYETGKKLKNNNPPIYLYKNLPEKHYFKKQPANPFNLEGEFYVKNAMIRKLIDIFKKLSK